MDHTHAYQVAWTVYSTFLVIFDLRMSDVRSMRRMRDHDIRFFHGLMPLHTGFQPIMTIS